MIDLDELRGMSLPDETRDGSDVRPPLSGESFSSDPVPGMPIPASVAAQAASAEEPASLPIPDREASQEQFLAAEQRPLLMAEPLSSDVRPGLAAAEGADQSRPPLSSGPELPPDVPHPPGIPGVREDTARPALTGGTDAVEPGLPGAGLGSAPALEPGNGGESDLIAAIEDLSEQTKRLADLMEKGEKGQAPIPPPLSSPSERESPEPPPFRSRLQASPSRGG